MPHIFIKKQGTEATLHEIVNWFQVNHPDWVSEWKREMLQLKKVSKATYKDEQGRESYVRFKVPSMLLLSIQHVMPGFGKDSDDIALMTRVLRDFDGAAEFKSRFSDSAAL